MIGLGRMRVLTVALSALALIAAASSSLVAQPRPLLFATSPAEDAIVTGPVDVLELNFARRVELHSLTIVLPDERTQDVVAASYVPGTKAAQAKRFAYAIDPPLTAPGRYAVSYLVAARGVRSLNGWLYFTIGAR